MDQLTFNDDVQVWQAEAMKRVRELFDSNASIMHYALSRPMKSFTGKLKTTPYKIAVDINSKEINETTYVFDMVQSYAADIASVGDSKHAAAYVGKDTRTCSYCKKKGHVEKDCRKSFCLALVSLRFLLWSHLA